MTGKDVFWTALMEDTNLPVMLIDSAGQIEYANPAASRRMGVEPGAAVGHNVREYWNEDLVNERLGLVRDVLSTGRTITVEGMVRGKLTRSTLRPIPGQGQKVLVVSRLATGAALGGNPEGVVRARVDEAGKLASLTARELEILKLIGLGYSTAQIAKTLGRSVKTVEWHRVSLGDKLGVINRVELARIAIAAGLVGLEEPAPAVVGDEE